MVISQSILEVYNWYKHDLLTVDRAYQRKLVWKLEEKQFLIDTLMHNYPIPMFMLIGGSPRDTLKPASVMDGLQRLEAIFAFIDNKYAICYEGKKQFFNLDCVPGYGIHIRNGQLKQRQPVLPADVCSNFLQYALPISFIEAGSTTVENVFKRINSTGRVLSPQSLRQSGVTSIFSSIVQNVASNIRGDYTEGQIVAFKDMEAISLSSPGLEYGIDTSKLFWIANDIINDDAIRRSKDEEIIANLLNCLINGDSVSMSREALNNVYDSSSTFYKKNEEVLKNSEQREYYTSLLLQVFTLFKNIVHNTKVSLAELLCGDPVAPNKDCIFITLFLAVARLYQQHYVVENVNVFADALHDLAALEMRELMLDQKRWNRNLREQLISRITPRLQNKMSYLNYDPKWNIKVQDILRKAQIESQLFDFKIGVTTFSSGVPIDNTLKVMEKCIETLIAMANSNPKQRVCVIIGVADNQASAECYSTAFNATYHKCNNVYITGINAEAQQLHMDVDHYIMRLKDVIASLHRFPAAIINNVLSSIDTVMYDGLTLLTLSLSTDTVLVVNNTVYIRTGNSNRALTMTDVNELISFTNQFNSRLVEESSTESRTGIFS